jgi:hypothetical protein
VGTLFHRHKTEVELDGGLECWLNEHGKPASIIPGVDELAPLFLVTLHLPGSRF